MVHEEGYSDKLGRKMIALLCTFLFGVKLAFWKMWHVIFQCLYFGRFERLKTMMLFAILVFLRIQEGNSRIQTRVVGYQVPNRHHDSQSKEEKSMEEKSYLVR